jgi:hypothetical protein
MTDVFANGSDYAEVTKYLTTQRLMTESIKGAGETCSVSYFTKKPVPFYG